MTCKEESSRRTAESLRVVRHTEVRQKLSVSEAKLFAMIAAGTFPKPFQLIPGGRSVGWLECDVDQWILDRKKAREESTI
jgi:prophage regulatory protein